MPIEIVLYELKSGAVQIETIEDEITSEKLHFRMKTLEF